VAELNEASKKLGAEATGVFQPHDQMGAVRLLSQHNFDALQWSNDVSNLSVQVAVHIQTIRIRIMTISVGVRIRVRARVRVTMSTLIL
jgi:hypothetical protein